MGTQNLEGHLPVMRFLRVDVVPDVVQLHSRTRPPMYGKSRAANSGDKSGARSLVEKMTCTSRQVKVCGMILRPCPGLLRPGIRSQRLSPGGAVFWPFRVATSVV